MKDALSRVSTRVVIMLSLIPIAIIGNLWIADNGITAGVVAFFATIMIYGNWIAFEANQYSKRRGMGNFEEYNLAWSYQNNDIGKMYKNFILVLVPILIFGGYYINDNIIHKEYSERLDNNFHVQLEAISGEDSLMDISDMLKDPLVSIIIEQKYTKELTTCGLVAMDTAVNAARTFTIAHVVKSFIADGGDVDAEGIEEIRVEINKSIDRIDGVYSKMMVDETSNSEVDKLTLEAVRVNTLFKEIDTKLLAALTDNSMTAEKYTEVLTEFGKGLEGRVEAIQSSITSLMDELKDNAWIHILLFRAGVLLTIFAILRLIGIAKYYVRLGQYRRSMNI